MMRRSLFSKDSSLRIFFWLLFLLSTAARVLLTLCSRTAVISNSEYDYLDLAQTFWLQGRLDVPFTPFRLPKLPYSMLLSPFCAITDGVLRTRLISVFNALLLSSSLIPGYLLAKRVLKSNTMIALSLLILAISPNLLLCCRYSAENLFLPLLLWCFLAAFGVISKITHDGRRRPFPSCVAISFLPLLPGLILLPVSDSPTVQFSLANLQTSSQLMYFFFATAAVLFFFALSVLFFPVLLPLAERRKLSSKQQLLLSCSLLYLLLVAAGIAFGLSLPADFPSVAPAVSLRYLIGAAWPFVLLFLSVWEEEQTDTDRSPFSLRSFVVGPLSRYCGLLGAFILLFFYVPARRSLANSPLLVFLDFLRPQSLKHLWLFRLALLSFLALSLLLRKEKKRKPFFSLLVAGILLVELVSGVTYIRSVRQEPIRFSLDAPDYQDYQPQGFSTPESGHIWSFGTESSLSFRPLPRSQAPLTALWQVKYTIGEQPFKVYANDTPVLSGVLNGAETLSILIPSETWQNSDLLTLRFVFPEAQEPGNGDPRILAAAFEFLTFLP